MNENELSVFMASVSLYVSTEWVAPVLRIQQIRGLKLALDIDCPD
jgi:hypothetical protein